MTSKTNIKLKTRILLALMILCLACTSIFALTACKNNESSSTDPSFSYSQVDDGLISNPNFLYGTKDLEHTSFPVKSPTGWSRSKDSTASSSSSRSGVIDVSEDGWNELLKNMYTDSYYLDFIENEYGFTKDSVKEEIKEENGTTTTPTSTEIKDFIVEKYMSKIPNPGTHDDATDNKVYMLNNYTSDIGFGASQKITSSKSITIKKGEFVQISFWLKTQHLSPFGVDYGASVRLTNTFNGSTQGEYVVKNIIADDWTKITLLVKGDANYDCAITLALGLGYGLNSQTEGTVYFDDIIVEELEEQPIATFTTSTLDYSNTDAIEVEYTNNNTTYYYDMTLVESNFVNELSLGTSVSGAYTKSNADSNITAKNKFGQNSETPYSIIGDELNVNLESSTSYTLKIQKGADDPATTDKIEGLFNVQPEGYTYVSFFIKNQLSKLGATSITVDLFEKTSTTPFKNAAITTISEVSEDWVKVEIIANNNFDSADATATEKEFYLEIVVGPTNILSATKKYEYASGTVSIKDLTYATGNTYLYNDEVRSLDKEDDENTVLYELHKSSADATVALFANYDNDYTKPSDEESQTYYFNTSSSDLANVGKRPTANNEYIGVTPSNIRITNDDTITSPETSYNDRVLGTTNGSFAGVVNSNYSYTGLDISALNNEQALMIYNATEDEGNYGFIGKTKTISANSFTKVSVTLKVSNTAKAFIYLVEIDANKGLRDVMSFNNFNVNTDGINDLDKDDQTAINGSDYKLCLEINDAQMAKAIDGWLTVDFYVATGASAKTFRLEMWNGSRDGQVKSTGYVFVKSVSFSLSAGFTEADSFENTFTVSGSTLYDLGEKAISESETLLYKRELTEKEKDFNTDYPNEKIKYSAKYVWVKNDTMVYAVYNSLDVQSYDPYDGIVDEEETTKTGCTAKTDPSTFWLQFSSILLVIALLVSIIALFFKNIRRRRKANASDAKSHYTIKSRVKTAKKAIKVVEEEPVIEEVETETQPEETKTTETEEQALEDYVYGDVQDFGEKSEESEKETNE